MGTSVVNTRKSATNSTKTQPTSRQEKRWQTYMVVVVIVVVVDVVVVVVVVVVVIYYACNT